MSTQEFYEQKLEAICAIPESDIICPTTVPVNVFIQEAENLYNWCQADKELLTAKGLQWNIVKDVPARIGALREAQSRWMVARNRHDNSEKVWFEKLPSAIELRNGILRSMRFAFNNNPALRGRVAAITKGGSQADMIQDLNDLSVLGKENTALLQAINFDISMLDTAAQTAVEMAALLGAVTTERSFCNSVIKIRNQAFTYLKEPVSEVRRYGQFIFWRDQARLKGYTSEYSRRVRRRRESKTTDEQATEAIS